MILVTKFAHHVRPCASRARLRLHPTTVTVSSRYLSIHRVAGSLGAEIHDVDLNTLASSPDKVKEIRQIFLDNKVIFFRNQQLSPSAFLSFTSLFGTPIEYPFVRGIDGHPQIIRVLKQAHETVNFGGIWHSDTSYFTEPPMASVLLAEEVPPVGGDTLFADQYAAYDGLSPGLKRTLDGLRAMSTSAKADTSKTREDRIKDSGNAESPSYFEACHPVVRTHPETGRRSLYVNVAHTSHFDGWTEDESAPLLAYLYQHQVRPEYTCRFRWEKGSIALWDNRCALHNPVNDYHGHRRSMLRITLKGDKPV